MLVLQANDLLATHPASSEKRHTQPCRRPHERKLCDQTKDDVDKEPREERSCGRSQALLYNLERPHQGLDMNVPADRFRPSSRVMPARIPKVQYDVGETVRTVSSTRSYISFKGQFWRVPQAFVGERLAIRPLDRDGNYGIFFASWQVALIDLTNGQPVSDVSEQVSAMSPG
jgi:hypothetical protein